MTRPRDCIVYEAEALPGGRGQMYCEVWEDGERIERHATGSPAPLETVREHERTITLEGP